MEIEAAPDYQHEACGLLASLIKTGLGIDCEINAVPPGGLVPNDVLTTAHDVIKPRSLFGQDEDWSKAVLYY